MKTIRLAWLAGLAGGSLLACGSDSGSGSPTAASASASSSTGSSAGPTGSGGASTTSTGQGAGTGGADTGASATTGVATGAGGSSAAMGTGGSSSAMGGGSSAGGSTGSTASGTGGISGSGGAAGAGNVDAGPPKDGGAPPPPGDAGSDASTGGHDGEISGIVGAVSSSRISSTINSLAAYTTRNSCSANTPAGNTLGAARDWVQKQFQAIGGLTVSLEPFTFSLTLPVDGTCGPVTDHNVLAVKLGAHPTRVIVLGGHYDSRTIGVLDPTGRAPGANDSGSQTALLLEAARVMAPLKFDATLIFAAFAGEEQGLYGSVQLAKDYPQYVMAGAKIEAMLDFDMVGGDTAANIPSDLQKFRLYSPGTPREIMLPLGTTDDESPSRGLMRYIGYWGGQYVPSMTMTAELREDRVGRGSDHESFLDLGYPGVRFIETNESPNSGMAGSHQHTADDLPMYVTPAYTTRIAQIAVAVGASLARAPMPPQIGNATGPAAGPWTVSWTAPASGTAVDHYVIAARPSTDNFYRTRVVVAGNKASQAVSAADLGVAGVAAFYVSVAAVDAAGHESLFAYPEYRCDSAGCTVPAGSLNVTARN